MLGIPADDQAHAQQAERDGALDGAGGAVAGLADPGDLPALFEQDLDRPAVGIAFDQLGWGGVQVGGDQGQLVAVGAPGSRTRMTRRGWAPNTAYHWQTRL